MRGIKMRTLAVLLSFAFLLPGLGYAQGTNGAVHIYLTPYDECERLEDERDDWYLLRQYLDNYGENGDPSDELQEDTSWPGQREEFSDQLFR